MSDAAERGVRPVRSALFVPGNRPELLTKATSTQADALVIDLEDAVPEHEKATARAATAEFLASRTTKQAVFVRVNGPDRPQFLQDVVASVDAGARVLVVPKVNGTRDAIAIDRLLDWLEAERGLDEKSTTVTPLLETARALRQSLEIADCSPRHAYMGALVAPGGDVERAIGFRWSAGGGESVALRALTLLSVRAAGTPNPLGGVWTDVKDTDGLRGFALDQRRLGYEGMFVIHPSHVEIINETFAVTEDERTRASEVVEGMDAAAQQGRGAVTVDGRMVDRAMYESARRTLERADQEEGARE